MTGLQTLQRGVEKANGIFYGRANKPSAARRQVVKVNLDVTAGAPAARHRHAELGAYV